MKLRITCFLILIPVFSFSQLDSLKGKVKSTYDTVSYTPDYNFFLITREFDQGQGPIYQDDLFSEFKGDLLPKGLFISDKKKEFDTAGRIIKLTSFFFKIGHSFYRQYSYDEYNNMVRETHYSDGVFAEGIDSRFRFFSDSIYRPSVVISYNDEPESFSMTEYFYNDSCRLIEKRESNSFQYNTKRNYGYDSKGNLTKEVFSRWEKKIHYDSLRGVSFVVDSADIYNETDLSYYPDGRLKEVINGCLPYLVKGACIKKLFAYENGKIKTLYFQWMDTVFSRREYEYNPDNTIKKISRFFKDEAISKNYVEYFYQDKELHKAIYIFNDKKAEIEFQYKVDAKKNWIEQTQYVNGKPTYIRKRVIEYW